MLIILFAMFVTSQVHEARGLAEPECGCSSDLRLIYSFMDDKFTIQDEIRQLKATLDELQTKLDNLERESKVRPTYVPGPNVNIAENYKMVTQSSEFPTPPHPAHQAIDVNSNTFSHTRVEPNAWWSMEFCNDVIIARVRLWNRVDCCDDQMANFVVTVDKVICGHVDGAIGVGKSVDVTCPKPLIVRPTYVPGPNVNIAENYKMVTQSSEFPTPPHPAHQAIDVNSNTFSHTCVEPNAWWSMEFCNDVIIARVRLWNRVDCCDDQMANFVVTVDKAICGHVDGAIGVGKSVDVTYPKPLIGKVLRVQRTANFHLSISELQVFSSINTCSEIIK